MLANHSHIHNEQREKAEEIFNLLRVLNTNQNS